MVRNWGETRHPSFPCPTRAAAVTPLSMRESPAFTPVPTRRARADGWTRERQRGFIAALAQCGDVAAAARAVGMSMQSAYRLRKRAGAESFSAAWEAALDQAGEDALDAVMARAINGVLLTRTYRGRFKGMVHRHDDRAVIRALTLTGWSPRR